MNFRGSDLLLIFSLGQPLSITSSNREASKSKLANGRNEKLVLGVASCPFSSGQLPVVKSSNWPAARCQTPKSGQLPVSFLFHYQLPDMRLTSIKPLAMLLLIYALGVVVLIIIDRFFYVDAFDR